ncbi:DUF3243 domain-containing protein [Oceanobacillus arenosus]|uniref:DUF3243 domain-containing protein n=1 Tax=Oceanobacillus arenosus TaxID=1229153 RepID=A0A3D8PWC6_9BACI|nr:DUF3243 domain-containing protein [Oceanobacillus arenosus]RDW20334.1 DUF3243 domain-containing protein [Oceanobacillus arenosus]
MSVLDNFDGWKDFLGDRLQNAEQGGMTEGAINNIATQIGDYLAKNVDPKNEEQRVLSDLWNAADDSQKQALAGAMVNLVKNTK